MIWKIHLELYINPFVLQVLKKPVMQFCESRACTLKGLASLQGRADHGIRRLYQKVYLAIIRFPHIKVAHSSYRPYELQIWIPHFV